MLSRLGKIRMLSYWTLDKTTGKEVGDDKLCFYKRDVMVHMVRLTYQKAVDGILLALPLSKCLISQDVQLCRMYISLWFHSSQVARMGLLVSDL